MSGDLERPRRRTLTGGWSLWRCEAGTYEDPGDLERAVAECALVATPGTVPCTVASALRDAGVVDLDDPADWVRLAALDHEEHWFRCSFDWQESDTRSVELVFEGLATCATVWLNGEALLESDNMFRRYVCEVGDRLSPQNELVIRFGPLDPLLSKRRPRARWRTRLVAERGLRFVRTTLFGRISSWCPPVVPVGPWGEIALEVRDASSLVLAVARHWSEVEGSNGVVHFSGELSLSTEQGSPQVEAACFLEVDGTSFPLEQVEAGEGRVMLSGQGVLEEIECWWPHTHLPQGERPRRYDVAIRCEMAGQVSRVALGSVGFRSIERDVGERFALRVNGESIFCRGTCWTPLDPLALRSHPDELRRALEAARDAGMNMIRVTGTVVYEMDEFYSLCDELGILVWQDFMFATFDYPIDDEAFRASIEQEVDQFLSRVAGRACVAVLCGNSEGQQQPAMLGLDRSIWESAFFDRWLPERCAALRPDIPYWVSTPSGGDLPFHTREGTAHYFGVGAYLRPLEDATVAQPTFITECLAFSNPPGVHGADLSPLERVPKDVGTDWNFADTTAYYCSVLFGDAEEGGHDAMADAELRRAAVAGVMESTQARWRDPRSSCPGALVLMHRDPWACAGWGVFDSEGRPKSALYGLARAWSPVAVMLFDDGLNGLRVVVCNDPATPLVCELEVELLRYDGTVVDRVAVPVELAGHASFDRSVDRLLGGFVDSSYAYRFGPRGFDLCVARLRVEGLSSEEASEAIHLPLSAGLRPREPIGLSAEWADEEDAILEVTTEVFAQTVSIEIEGGVAQDNFFHLAPGRTRRIRVRPHGREPLGGGTLGALNAERSSVVDAPLDGRSRPRGRTAR